MTKTLYQILVEQGWQPDKDTFGDGGLARMRFFLFGLTIGRVFHPEEMDKTGLEAERIASYVTEKAMYELVRMMYQALYEKGNNALQRD